MRRAKLGPDHPDDAGHAVQPRHRLPRRRTSRRRHSPARRASSQKGRKYPDAGVGRQCPADGLLQRKKAEATALVTSASGQAARKQFPADSLGLAAALADIGEALLDAKAYAEAEPHARGKAIRG